MDKGTHLAAVTSEMYERQWERFYVRRPARLTAVSPGLAALTVRSCQIVDISRGGAGLEIDLTSGLPQHYYLEIIGLAKRIGCAEVYRNGHRAGVKFIATLPEHILRDVVRADFMMGDALTRKRPELMVGTPPGMGRF